MVFAKEQIEIVATLVNNVSGTARQTVTSMQELGVGTQRLTKSTFEWNAANKQVPMIMEKMRGGALSYEEGLSQATAAGGRLTNSSHEMTRGMHRFKMELLGVMFAGMALWRVTSGLIKAQLQLFGITDMFGQMMTMIFLPVMTLLAPILYQIMEYFMNLPEGVKMAISVFIILAGLLGLALMLFGQFGLAFFSVLKAFPFLKIGFVAVKAAIAGLGISVGVAIAIIAAVIAIIIGMYVAWKENFMNMREIVHDFVENIKTIWKSFWDMIKSIFGFWIALFKGDWDGAWQHLKKGFTAVWNFIKNLLLAFLNFCAMIAIGVIRVFKWIVDTIVGFFKWLYRMLVGGSIIPEMITAMIAWFWKLPKAIMEALMSILKKVYNWGIDFIQNIIDGIKSMGRKVIDAILSLFPSWMRKSIESAGTITINIVKSITEKVKKVFGGSKDDFIWRPGQAPISINPKDTLVGFKGVPPNLGGGKGEVVINQTNYINITDKEETEKLIRENNVHLVEEIKRQVAV